jgi:hypothetical protein
MVKVLPKNEAMRKLLKHPSDNVAFPEANAERNWLDWPDDSFTHRRITDGDVTVVEEKKPEEKKPAEDKAASEEKPSPAQRKN